MTSGQSMQRDPDAKFSNKTTQVSESKSKFDAFTEASGAPRGSQTSDLYRQIFDHHPGAIMVIAANGQIVQANAYCEKLFGYARGSLPGLSIRDLAPEALRSKLIRPGKKFAAGHSQTTHGARSKLAGRSKDGSEFPVEFSLSPMSTGDSDLVIASIRNVAERRRMDERFREIVETAPNATILIRQDGAIDLINAQTEKLFGYKRSELLGQPVEILIPKQVRQSHPALRDHFFRNPGARSMGSGRDLFGLTRDGREVPIEIGLSPIKTSEGMFVLAAVIDITERKKLEDRFRKVVEAAPNAMIMIRRDGTIELINTQTEKLFGYSRAELIGQPVEMLVPRHVQTAHPKLVEKYFENPGTRAMGSGRDLFGLTRDGREVPIEIGLNPIESDNGSFVLASVIDITERRRAAKIQEELNQSLARQVEETNLAMSRLQDTQEQLILAEKMASLGGLVAGVAHEINTPVGIGVTAASHLWDEAKRVNQLSSDGKLTRKEFDKFLALSQQSGQMLLSNLQRAAELIQSFKRVAVDQSTDERRQVNLGRYIEEIMLSLKPRLKVCQHQIHIQCDEDIDIRTVPGAWSQVMTNLILNAVTHAWPAGTQGVLTINAVKQGSGASLSISDNGAGIAPEVLPKIFDPFFTTKRGQGGTGLGLNIVFNLITQTLGGSIDVTSAAGEGTTFTITTTR